LSEFTYLNPILTQPPCERALTGRGSRVYPNDRGSRVYPNGRDSGAGPGRGSRVYPNGRGSRARPGRGRGCARASPSRFALRAHGSGFALTTIKWIHLFCTDEFME